MYQRHVVSSVLAAAACILLVSAGTPALAADPPTNRQLIASMPDDIESVLIMQKEQLLREDCGMKDSCEAMFGVARVPADDSIYRSRGIVASLGDNNLDRVVYCELIRRKPTMRLLGGSDYHSPRAFGIGAFRYVSVWVTEDSNAPVREKIDRYVSARMAEDSSLPVRDKTDSKKDHEIVGPVTKTSIDGLDVYSSPIRLGWSALEADVPAEQPVFIAFPTEHIAVTAMSAADVQYISQALQTRADWIPARWEAAASGVDVESALLVLRNLVNGEKTVTRRDPENYKRAMVTQVPIDSYALTSEGGPVVSFRLRVITSQPEVAVRPFYGRTVFSGFAPVNWDWSRESDDAGFTAEVTFKYRPGSRHHCSLIIFTLLGVEIAM